MSSITTDQGILHYEVLGRGKPVIFLHGWLGSWGLWKETIETIALTNRAYALDFWGFGDSDDKRSTYRVQDFVALIRQFMDQLGLEKVPLVGHSMGGTVSLMTALTHPERVERLAVIGSPIAGSSLSFFLQLAGRRMIAELIFKNFNTFRLLLKKAAPLICRHPDFPEIIDRDLSKTNLESFLNSIHSLHKVDLREEISALKIPVLGIYGNRDNIVSPRQYKPLYSAIPQAQIELFPGSGHFIMLEEPQSFIHLIREFINQEPQSNL